MAIVSSESVFPFVVESVSPERVQFWAQYAASAVTQDQVVVVQDVFYVLWREMFMAESYQLAVSRMSRQDAFSALGWLDLVVNDILFILGEYGWPCVLGRLGQLLGEGAAANQWYQDASGRLQAVQQLCQQVVEYIMVVCGELQCALPEHTAAYLGKEAIVLPSM